MDRFAWQHIEFEDGSNPYICKTAKAMDWMRQKYNLVPLRDNFWLAKTVKER